MPFGLVAIFFWLCSLLESDLLNAFHIQGIHETFNSLSSAIAGHRARCSQFANGCDIDAKSLCSLASFPATNCRWIGGANAQDSIRFYSKNGAASSMGHFMINSGKYQARVVVSYFGLCELHHEKVET